MPKPGKRERLEARTADTVAKLTEARVKRASAPWGRLSRLACHKDIAIGNRRGYDWLLVQRPRGGHW